MVFHQQDSALRHPTADQSAQLLHVGGTNATCRLIQQQNLRVAHQRPGQRDTLLHRIGHLTGQAVRLRQNTQFRHGRLGLLPNESLLGVGPRHGECVRDDA